MIESTVHHEPVSRADPSLPVGILAIPCPFFPKVGLFVSRSQRDISRYSNSERGYGWPRADFDGW
jgi:hypothetical protein